MDTNVKEMPMSENGPQRAVPQQDAVTRAMEASWRLLDAVGKAGTACYEACQESVLGMPMVHDKAADAAPAHWGMLLSQLGFPGASPLTDQWQNAVAAPMSPEELLTAGKRMCLECLDSCEQAALTAIDLRERFAQATDLDWMQSLASTQAQAARDVTKAYISSVRTLLN
jgi:hypothetical protein